MHLTNALATQVRPPLACVKQQVHVDIYRLRLSGMLWLGYPQAVRYRLAADWKGMCVLGTARHNMQKSRSSVCSDGLVSAV